VLDKNSNVLILSHFFVRTISAGPPQDVRDFLLPKVKSIVYIEHPFPYNVKQGEDTRSALTIYEYGKLKKRLYFSFGKWPDILFYIKDIIITQWFLLRSRRRFTLCVALDNLNTLSVLLWRKLGIIKKLVYYTIDFNPRRFENRLLNFIYHWIDRICCYYSDYIWILADRMLEGRKQKGVNIDRCAPTIIVPMGAHLSRIKKVPLESIERHTLVYVGTLSEKQGVQMVLRVLPDIKREVFDVKFVIIGKGDYEKEIKDLTKQLEIEDVVDFKGFIGDNRKVERILSHCAIGVAPYVPEETNYVFYTDPGKPKLYLGCGLPVVITRFPTIADEIEKKGAGIAVEYSEKSLKEALLKLLKDERFYYVCRENAIKFSQQFDTTYILTKALDKTGCFCESEE